ncbi:hypothetical protein ACU635_43215 [[Actinomadura] parvosata]|uniref:hypothetical protein n=1 Tax=[Actinomadura] parvosata TaxID=1955412 RepID=UPI00406C6A64
MVRYIDNAYQHGHLHPGDDVYTGLAWLDTKHLTGEAPFEGSRTDGLITWTNSDTGKQDIQRTEDPGWLADYFAEHCPEFIDVRIYTREVRLTVSAWAEVERTST